MKRVFLSLAVVLALLTGLHGTALAVTNGVPDGDMHPYVGLLILALNRFQGGERDLIR
jgi:hypothetical protein